MGSDSDWPTMQAAADALAEFGIAFEADVVSAHRMPDEMLDYGRAAHGRGLRVIIAGAGGAAHLPGMLAAVTPLPVIGVPVPLKYLDGMDSLLSIVQMPAGVPVATVSIGNARNAGLLAARILGASDDRVRAAMVDFQAAWPISARAKGQTCATTASDRESTDERSREGLPAHRPAQDRDDVPAERVAGQPRSASSTGSRVPRRTGRAGAEPGGLGPAGPQATGGRRQTDRRAVGRLVAHINTSGQPTALISEEHFSLSTPKQVRTVRRLVPRRRGACRS